MLDALKPAALGLLLATLSSGCVFDSGGVDPEEEPGAGTDAGTLPALESALPGQFPGGGTNGSSSDAQVPGDDVAVCHVVSAQPFKAHTLFVDAPAVAAHLRHGDSLGACGP